MLASDHILRDLSLLPPAPQILPRLLKALSHSHTSNREVVDILKVEPSLTAHLLQLCNSAYFASGSEIESIDEAVLRLGFDEVYKLATSLCCEEMLSRPQRGYGIDRGELWKHSVVAAIASSMLARRVDVDSSLMFTAGLLHDLGKIVLSEVLVDQYAMVSKQIEHHHQPFVEAEKTVLGVEHAEVGGRLLEKWSFSERLVAAVRHHHQPEAAGEHRKLVALVCMGDMLTHLLGYSYGHYALAMQSRVEALDILGLDQQATEPLLIELSEEIRAHEQLLRIAI